MNPEIGEPRSLTLEDPECLGLRAFQVESRISEKVDLGDRVGNSPTLNIVTLEYIERSVYYL